MGRGTVSVELTPDGRGDALVDIGKCNARDGSKANELAKPYDVGSMRHTSSNECASNPHGSDHQNQTSTSDTRQDKIFVMPATVSMTMSDFFEHQRICNEYKENVMKARSQPNMSSNPDRILSDPSSNPEPPTSTRVVPGLNVASGSTPATQDTDTPPAVAYISHQDSSLTDEYQYLLADVHEFEFARLVLVSVECAHIVTPN